MFSNTQDGKDTKAQSSTRHRFVDIQPKLKVRKKMLTQPIRHRTTDGKNLHQKGFTSHTLKITGSIPDWLVFIIASGHTEHTKEEGKKAPQLSVGKSSKRTRK